ncbi:sterol desaturase family protein [Litorimonas sp. RW-G-Af-16]|uniref:sterol desaturase family protein n=1 Tax=Litorimonas sp. RW-G-Af-16 TaxID=3241168 RepID=UPI00390C9D11
MEILLTHEGLIRLSVFAAALIVFAVLEAAWPRKVRSQKRGPRWLSNLALVGIDTLVLRVLFPVVAVGVAAFASTQGWGLFNYLALPIWLEIALAVIVLDMLIYWQHRLFHAVPFFWRFHKVHHADRDLDVSSGVRFHPVEIVFSMAYKIICVLILGPAVAAVILFEIILNASALFNHANIRLPAWLDQVMRKLIVTPDFHRVHHSIQMRESNQNFGFCLSIWDHLFGSYTAQPEGGHDGMVIGLSEAQTDDPNHLIWSLTLPFKSTK